MCRNNGKKIVQLYRYRFEETISVLQYLYLHDIYIKGMTTTSVIRNILYNKLLPFIQTL